ncbi:ESX secretion-associated protein EspG [Nocardia huaxiensis]|uniref:ESX secretion-associated protein EspG n=1 Tax=Nocardia huaxiensis TaxID=2755382 RepID=A0A7D6Z5V1_9NOCA|nr:ESX secretion-associated protein EspG [Nocardia huaxiensis]QLY32224.1 ESX secretion-associated protein EspG [Nocardia huaxiensis]UFS94072.1 ESX secretion-associated protein EspG [Nocardia huaxiensis]
MKWILTPDEFALVWARETDMERRPYPLDGLPLSPETDCDSPRLRHRYLRRTDPDLAAALILCARSDTTTITLYGEQTAGPEPRRILAFAAVAQQRAGILIAQPDAVTVLVRPAESLGRELVEIIGSAPAGRSETMREPHAAVLHERAGEADGAGRFRSKLRQPVDGRGFITVTVEPANPLAPPTRHRTWLDFSGDGRYLLTTAADLTLTPVTDAELADHLMRLARV